MTARFGNKRAIVTGGASGIGAATAHLLIAGGAKVMVADIAEDGVQSIAMKLGASAVPFVVDLSERAQVEAMVAKAVNDFGGLDILVNNAGIGAFGRVADADPDEWRKVMAIDLDAVFYASRVALPHLVEAGGCIVNTASISGIAADYAMSTYNSAKAAVINLTRGMAIDYAAQGVRVNAVSPGFTATAIVSGMPEALVAQYSARIPMGRPGRAEEIANVIAFLASDEASYLTGQNIAVDGGVTAHTGLPNLLAFAMGQQPSS